MKSTWARRERACALIDSDERVSDFNRTFADDLSEESSKTRLS